MQNSNYRHFESSPQKGFAPAFRDEKFIYGSRRPGFLLNKVPKEIVKEWIIFMKSNNIKRVMCLLSRREMDAYDNLILQYKNSFGNSNVCWEPIKDFSLIDSEIMLSVILPFIKESENIDKKAVVHCSGGIGRTGQVLAGWLVCYKGYDISEAFNVLRLSGRKPCEGNNLDKLYHNLSFCRSHIR